MKNNKQLAALIPYLFVLVAVMSLMFMNIGNAKTDITYQQYVDLLNKKQVVTSNVTVSEVVLTIDGVYTDTKGVQTVYTLTVPNTEFQNNSIIELINERSKEVKIIKARENQSKEVKNLPVSALFMGSQDNLLYDDAIKRKFKTEFTTKLARRSFFIFANENIFKLSG